MVFFFRFRWQDVWEVDPGAPDMHHVHVCTVQYIGNNNNYGVSM